MKKLSNYLIIKSFSIDLYIFVVLVLFNHLNRIFSYLSHVCKVAEILRLPTFASNYHNSPRHSGEEHKRQLQNLKDRFWTRSPASPDRLPE